MPVESSNSQRGKRCRNTKTKKQKYANKLASSDHGLTLRLTSILRRASRTAMGNISPLVGPSRYFTTFYLVQLVIPHQLNHPVPKI